MNKKYWDYFTSLSSLSAKDFKVTVTGGQPIQTDFTAPEVSSTVFLIPLSVLRRPVKHYKYIMMPLTGSGINYLSIGFRDEVSGQTLVVMIMIVTVLSQFTYQTAWLPVTIQLQT